LAKQFKKIQDMAVAEYTGLVDDVVHDRITDERSIERIMDGLTDFPTTLNVSSCIGNCADTSTTAIQSLCASMFICC